MDHFRKGFSLIELMLVVAIISLLAAISLPSYQHYAQRARFTEIVTAAAPFKLAIALAIQQGESLNDLQLNSYGIPDAPQSTNNLASLGVNKGIITVIATNRLHNATYVLTPNVDATHWRIGGTCLKHNLCAA